MLHSPELHSPLTDRGWDEGWIRDRIAAVVRDTERAHDPDTLWPAHEWDAWQVELPVKTLYVGAAGAVWGLHALAQRGYETTIDLARTARHTLELWQQSPGYWSEWELPPARESSLFHGETGLLLTAYRLDPSPALADRLHARALENVANDAVEVMWGQPGTMLVARALHEWTGEQRWLDVWQACAGELRRRRDDEGLWTNRLYGTTFRSLTPPHGLVGIVSALLAEPDDALAREAAATLAAHAVRDGDLANWPNRPGNALDQPEGVRKLQWCAGAPGIVIGAADYLDEDLMVAGAELTWRAGPLSDEKGAGICHGTAGNGYALLKAFERTQDERWLERARRFAVHALEQVERLPGRYSLFTGGVGAALFADDCLRARARFPVTDTLSG